MDNLSRTEDKIALIKQHIGQHPDFPKKGVLFRDIYSALLNGNVCRALKEVLIESVKEEFPGVEAIVGLEARGFLFSFTIAAELGVGCVLVRKKGKLPGNVISLSYTLEYGTDTFEIQKSSLEKPGLKCLIVDDLLATGGTMEAAVKLLQQNGCEVMGCLTALELQDLKGREKLSFVPKVISLIKY